MRTQGCKPRAKAAGVTAPGLKEDACQALSETRHYWRKTVIGRVMMRRMQAPIIPDLDALRLRIRVFAAEREWQPYHTPKNLAMALIVEAAELVEQFQWLTPEQSSALSNEQLEAVRHEVADVLIYLTRLADLLDIDLLTAASAKMEINARKYPPLNPARQ